MMACAHCHTALAEWTFGVNGVIDGQEIERAGRWRARIASPELLDRCTRCGMVEWVTAIDTRTRAAAKGGNTVGALLGNRGAPIASWGGLGPLSDQSD
jgi:hypothetical protein